MRAGAMGIAQPASTQFPARPVRVIIPQGPGSTIDLLGRIVLMHTARVSRVMNEALRSVELRKLFFELGEVPASGSPEDFGKLIREDYEQMGKPVKLAGIKLE
jgi:tripartite-type tricarboxylate transporter receptor subunit TctC